MDSTITSGQKRRWTLADINWQFVLQLGFVHVLALWAMYRTLFYGHYSTLAFAYVLGMLTGVGTLAGAHRLFSHRSFKAHWTFRLFLLTCQTIAGQGSAVRWAREHRTHHRFTGTDADCANISRGFFYSHIGWLLLNPHPERVKRESECDLSDLMADPMIKFQYDYYIPLMILLNIVIPTWVPCYFFNENLIDAFLGCFALRYVYTLHIAFCGNSVAHYFGSRPYHKDCSATHCDWIIWATLGAAYHNYHHVFPYDYCASEFGVRANFNLNTLLIDTAAFLGLVYDRKRAPKRTVDRWKHQFGDPELSIPKRAAWLDWLAGLTISASPVWIVLIGRTFVNLLFSH